MRYIFAPVITIEATYYLQFLIADHLELFTQLFPDETLKPKQHYLTHYPRCIRMVGPLVRLWAMRFEAKHNFFKRLAHITCNFKNICKTMAQRHQMYQCYRFCAKEHIDTSSLEVGHGEVSLLTLEENCELVCSALNIDCYTDIFLATWVKCYGVTYKPGMCVITDVTEEGWPEVWKILYLAIIEGDLHCVAERWKTICFDRHIWAYRVTQFQPNCLKQIEIDKLLDHQPVHLKNSHITDDSGVYITLKYKPI